MKQNNRPIEQTHDRQNDRTIYKAINVNDRRIDRWIDRRIDRQNDIEQQKNR